MQAITGEAQSLFLELDESVKNEDHGTALFVKGRDKADFAGLRGLIHDQPAIKPLLTTGDRSCRLTFKKD